MGVYNSELYNNLGLCCFYAQQYDMTLTCFERALSLGNDQNLGDVWYNIGHAALVSALMLSVIYNKNYHTIMYIEKTHLKYSENISF